MTIQPAEKRAHSAADGRDEAGPAGRYAVEASVLEKGISTASCKDAQPLRFDSSAGQNATLFGPADLLVAAFAACVLKNVERLSTILSFQYETASISVVAQRKERPPRIVAIEYELRVVTEESAHRVDLLHRNIVQFGTIYNTLAAVCDVSGSIIAERPTSVATHVDVERSA